MPSLTFPFGTTAMTADIPDCRFAGCLVPATGDFKPEQSEWDIVADALKAPIASPKLCELATGKKNIVLIASDHTRPVPSKIIVPQMLAEIRKGNPNADITILVAVGSHRKSSREELIAKFGADIVNTEHIVIHDCDDTEKLVHIATLPSGGDLEVNKIALDADLLVSEGFIEPHFFAGFSGGRKSVLPGICSRKTIMHNHNARFIASPYARTGVLDKNPIHEDMAWAARKAGLRFIVNVVLDAEKHVVYAAAGDAIKAHEKGCEFLSSQCRVSGNKADIVITSNGGHPLDQNIYQAVKGMTTAEALVKEGGVTIMLARSGDGHGGQSFYETFRDQPDLKQMMEDFLSTPAEKTIIDQWQSQIFARVLMHSTVIFISEAPDQLVRELHMLPAHSIEEALQKADAILKEKHGPDFEGTILAVPDGVSVIVEKKQEDLICHEKSSDSL